MFLGFLSCAFLKQAEGFCANWGTESNCRRSDNLGKAIPSSYWRSYPEDSGREGAVTPGCARVVLESKGNTTVPPAGDLSLSESGGGEQSEGQEVASAMLSKIEVTSHM